MADLPVTEDILLRTPALPYGQVLFDLVERNRDHLRQWLPWVDGVASVQVERRWIEAHLDEERLRWEYPWMMLYRKQVVGVIGVLNLGSSNKAAEIGYWIAEDAQHKGIVTRSCAALLDWTFDRQGMHRVQIRANPDNRPSCAIPERLGFTCEGVQREAGLLDGRYYDLVVYAILDREWRAIRR